MPASIKIAACFLIFSMALPVLRAHEPPATPSARPFRYATDSFAFANETVWNYVNGTVQPESDANARKREYTQHCFVMSRAVVQFWKFARYDPTAKPLTAGPLAARIRKVTATPVWEAPLADSERVVFPGYHNLREISAAFPGIFESNMGASWPFFFRPGNMPITLPVYRGMEAQLNDEIIRDLQKGYPTIVWVYLFPSLKINHLVVIFSVKQDHDRFTYQVCDPNYSDGPKTLRYNAAIRTFSYQPTFYFKGGPVSVRAMYRGPLL